MSELNLTRKTFLEVEELNRFQEFLQDDIATNTIVSNTTQFGIIQTNFTGTDTNFQVSQGTGSGTIQFATARSQALDADGRLIRLLATDNIAVTDDSSWYWIRISHEFRRHEVGTVSINTDGQMTGTGTLFNQVLRGQATDVPVRIRFQEIDGTNATNNGDYEVVDVIDDTNAILTSSVVFQTEADLRYIVIGSTPIGEVVSTAQREGIYQYDSCNVELIAETTLETPPALPANGTGRYFYVARVMNVGGTVTVQDQRDIDDTYWKFDVPGIQGAIITRPLPAPTAINQYMLIGTIELVVSHFVRLFWQGCGQNDGTVIDLRLENVRSGGTSTPAITDIVIAGTGTHRPRFVHEIDAANSRVNIYARSTDQTSAAPFLPGYVSFVGENIQAGGTAFSFADNFTWTNTAPTIAPVTSTTRFATYGTDQIMTDVNGAIAQINADLANRLLNSQNLSDVNSTTQARSNLNVYSQTEVDNIVNGRGALVYAAFVVWQDTNITLTEHVNLNSFISGVAESGTEVLGFSLTTSNANWETELEIQATPNPRTTASLMRAPHFFYQVADRIDMHLVDRNGGPDDSGGLWIRIYNWA